MRVEIYSNPFGDAISSNGFTISRDYIVAIYLYTGVSRWVYTASADITRMVTTVMERTLEGYEYGYFIDTLPRECVLLAAIAVTKPKDVDNQLAKYYPELLL